MSLPVPVRNPQLRDVIVQKIWDILRGCHTAMPGVVTRVDPSGQLVDVQPQVEASTRDQTAAVVTAPLPVVTNCPVLIMSGGGYRLTFPVAVGDTVELLCQESSIDVWQQNGGTVDPQDLRRFALADAVAVVGLRPNSAPWTVSKRGVQIGQEGAASQLIVTATGIELGGTDSAPPTDFMALASLVLGQLQALSAAFTAWTPTGVVGDGPALKALLTTLQATWPTSVASATIKAK